MAEDEGKYQMKFAELILSIFQFRQSETKLKIKNMTRQAL